jgi:hypothetical protein
MLRAASHSSKQESGILKAKAFAIFNSIQIKGVDLNISLPDQHPPEVDLRERILHALTIGMKRSRNILHPGCSIRDLEKICRHVHKAGRHMVVPILQQLLQSGVIEIQQTRVNTNRYVLRSH